jgi:hypothetical protein
MEKLNTAKYEENISDKTLLETCIKAFEIAIQQIRILENSEIIEEPCKKANPDGLDCCAGSTDKTYIDVYQNSLKYINNAEFIKLRDKAFDAMKMEFEKYKQEHIS